MSELDAAARVTWIEMGEMKPTDPGYAKLDFSRSRAFESVRGAVRFVMEGMTKTNRGTAIIHVGGRQISFAEIEVLYSQIRRS
jgi:hypothetical protein